MEDDPKSYTPEKPGRLFFLGWFVAVVVLLGLTGGLVLARSLRLNRQTDELKHQNAIGPRVLVAPVIHSPRTRTIEIPATIHGYVETPVYAKIAGYLKTIRVDKGDRVEAGQVIAILDTPELDHQVANTRASYGIALLTYQRDEALRRDDAVAQQVADEARASMVEAKATLDQLASMQAYKVIRAPFTGIITARYVDQGALVPQVTSPSAASTPIVAMATISPLRVYASAPQSVAPFIRNGDAATITVTEYPQRTFRGVVARHPEALTSDTRTMLVEVDLTNEDRTLYPGMYAKLVLDVATPAGVPMVPDDALVFRDGKPYVPVVRGGRLRLAAVTLGYDNGVNVEITEGVSDQDMVALNVGQAASDGEPVQPVTAQQLQ
jgi:membrane fusion protein (multidrug efflux system)